MAKKSTSLKDAMNAINRSLAGFDGPTSSMAVAAVAGVYAAAPRGQLKRFAGIGANIDTMLSAFNETVKFNSEKKRQRRKSK